MSAIISTPTNQGLSLPLLRDDDPRFAQYMPMVRLWAKKFYFGSTLHRTHTLPELEAIGLRGLWNAIETFDPNRDTEFTTWAYRGIRQSLSRENSKYSRTKHIQRLVSLSAAATTADGEESDPWELMSPSKSPEELAEVSLTVGRLRAVVAALNPRQREFLAARFGEGSTLLEVGEALGVSKQRAAQIEGTTLRQIRGLLDRKSGA